MILVSGLCTVFRVHSCSVEWPWRLTSYLFYAGIESEWRKTQCIPREVCVDVGREFGAPTNIFYKPPCVSVYRCGGCCHSEDKQCRNISTGYLSKTVSVCVKMNNLYCAYAFTLQHCVFDFKDSNNRPRLTVGQSFSWLKASFGFHLGVGGVVAAGGTY